TRRCAIRARKRAEADSGARLPHIRLARAIFTATKWTGIGRPGSRDRRGSRRVNHAFDRHGLSPSAGLASSTPDAADRNMGRNPMGILRFGWPLLVFALSALQACTTTGPQAEAPAPPQPELPSKVRPSEIVGRWGYAAYHKPEDRARTEANARGQCK